jgi:hypothetical protein
VLEADDMLSADVDVGGVAESEVLDVLAVCQLDLDLAVLDETREIDIRGARKRQRMRFFTVCVHEESGNALYADWRAVTLQRILSLHGLPRRVISPRFPVVLAGAVVGHLFHEYAHLLETDIHSPAAFGRWRGRRPFQHREISLFEDPTVPSVGFSAFTDEGKATRRVPLMKNGTIVAFLDSMSHPDAHLGCGYVGYGPAMYPIPRTLNLVVEAGAEHIPAPRGIVVTGLNLKLASADPLRTDLMIRGGEGVYVEDEVPQFRTPLDFRWRGTLQALVSCLAFLAENPWPAEIGGMCVKRGIAVRSAQQAPAALLSRLPPPMEG